MGLPGLIVALGALTYGIALLGTTGGFVRAELPHRQIVGTVSLFVLLPAYLIWLIPVMQRRTEECIQELAEIARPEDVEAVRQNSLRISGVIWPGMLAGIAFGVSQNPIFIEQMRVSGVYQFLDVAFVVGATGLWVVVAFLLSWRLPTSRALSRLGEGIDLDLYRLDRVQPLARVATTDILVVVGAMAFSALQSLDAEFRFGNYMPTVFVGVPAAVVLFCLPLWGVHRNMQRTKQQRLAVLRARMDGIDRDDIAQLEPLTAHIERVRTTPTWPVDLEILARVFGYVIIPPLAWVAAALVENFIDRMSG